MVIAESDALQGNEVLVLDVSFEYRSAYEESARLGGEHSYLAL